MSLFPVYCNCIFYLVVIIILRLILSLCLPSSSGYGKHGQYTSPVDSAIGSGVTTKAPSIVGDYDDLDHLTADDFPPPSTTISHGHAPPSMQPHLPPLQNQDRLGKGEKRLINIVINYSWSESNLINN